MSRKYNQKLVQGKYYCPKCESYLESKKFKRVDGIRKAYCIPCVSNYQKAYKLAHKKPRTTPSKAAKLYYYNRGIKDYDVYVEVMKLLCEAYDCKVTLHRYSRNPRRKMLIRFYDDKDNYELEFTQATKLKPYFNKVIEGNRHLEWAHFSKYVRDKICKASTKAFDPVIDYMCLVVKRHIAETGQLNNKDIRTMRNHWRYRLECLDTKVLGRFHLTLIKMELHKRNIIPQEFNITPCHLRVNLDLAFEYTFDGLKNSSHRRLENAANKKY
jgi:hypothetical protein